MKKLFCLLLAVIAFSNTFAQLVASNDTTICAGQQVQLNVTGGTTYTWTPSNTLSGSTTATPVAAPTTTTSYIVSSTVNTGNVFVNGNFAQGNTGFTSGYTYILPPNVIGNAMYWVGGTPTLFSNGMLNCSDHTTGVDTNQLIADGATVANTPMWCQTVSVVPNTTYSLSGYIHPLNNINMPSGLWSVNGVVLSGSSPTPFAPCLWANFTANWNSGANTSATFCVYSDHLQANGNDFAIDDLSLTANVTYRDTVTVTVINAPVVSLGNDTSICNGSSLTFNAQNAGSSFLWSDNSTLQTLTVNSTSGYSVTVTNSANCSASDAITVNTYSVSVTPTSLNTTCGSNNGSVTLNCSGGFSPYSYLWSNSSTNDTIGNLAAGNYSVTVSDLNSCSATAIAVISPSGTGSVTITSNALQICATDSADVCAPTGYNSYLWNTGATSVCIHPSLAGNYYVTVTDNANCSSTSNHVAVSVYPVPSVSVSVNGDTLAAYNAIAYQWYYNGNLLQGETGNIYIATQQGSYYVMIVDTNGCSAVSNNILVNGIGELKEKSALRVFPNPSLTGSWHLDVDISLLGSEMELTDINGRIIYQSTIISIQSTIQPNVESGTYLLRIVSKGQNFVKRIIRY